VTCPALPVGDDATLSATLTAIDCQLNAGVAGAYGRLFASGGALSLALTSVLTIYIAILAFGLLTGRTRLTLHALAPKAVAICLVLTFATSWQAYHVVIHALLSGGPDQIAAIMLGARDGATHAFASRVDGLFNSVLEASRAVANASQGEAPNAQNATALMWFSGLELLLSTVGLLVASRILLAILLAVGPVFIVLALFSNTRGLFEAWLRTTLAFALAPMLIVLGGGAVLAALEPIIAAIVNDPAGALANQRPIIMLFIGVNVYAVLVLAAAWTAFSLTRGWKTERSEPAPEAGRFIATNNDARPPSSATVVVQGRATELATVLTRERLAAPAMVSPLQSAAHDSAPRTAVRRRTGLGHTFRKTSA
jgi:type IV secretion system protein VirB6